MSEIAKDVMLRAIKDWCGDASSPMWGNLIDAQLAALNAAGLTIATKALLDGLKDPATVYVNMLRGDIAMPKRLAEQEQYIASLRAALEVAPRS